MPCLAIKNGRGETLYCAIVQAIKGESGVPKQGAVLANNSIDSYTKALNQTNVLYRPNHAAAHRFPNTTRAGEYPIPYVLT